MRPGFCWLALSAAAFSASSAQAGALTNIFLNSISPYASVSWDEGYQEGNREVLSGVVLKSPEGLRVDLDRLVMDTDGEQLFFDADNVRLEPNDDYLLLEAKNISFQGGPSHLDALWAFTLLQDACPLEGLPAKIDFSEIGVIIPRPEGDAVIRDAGDEIVIMEKTRRTKLKRLSISEETLQTAAGCRANVNLRLEGLDDKRWDGSIAVADYIEASFEGPGNLGSLGRDPEQDIKVTFDTRNASRLISGGATAWAVSTGSFQTSFPALSIVPALTHSLKYRYQAKDAGYWMKLWNSFTGFSGSGGYALENISIRTSNVLPTKYVAKFKSAGLTTIIGSTEGKFEAEGGEIDLQASLFASGMMSSDITAKIGINPYADEVIAKQIQMPSVQNAIPPLSIENLEYSHTDDGLVAAIGEIIGIPLTVRISQIQADQTAVNTESSSVIAKVGTDIANFSLQSYNNPPAKLTLALNPAVDLRQALLIAERFPGEIPNIFKYSVSSGAGQ